MPSAGHKAFPEGSKCWAKTNAEPARYEDQTTNMPPAPSLASTGNCSQAATVSTGVFVLGSEDQPADALMGQRAGLKTRRRVMIGRGIRIPIAGPAPDRSAGRRRLRE